MIKVLVIDDSALVREMLVSILSEDPEIEVVGTATNPIAAIKKIKETKPDVITLDLEMPQMDGLTFLKKLMSVYPTPVVVISSRAKMGCKTTVEALKLGAISVVTKPSLGIGEGLLRMQKNIVNAIKEAAKVDMQKKRERARENVLKERKKNQERFQTKYGNEPIIAIGASTGGTAAVRNILTKFPENFPSIFIILHMPPGFTKSYAEGLNRDCLIRVKEIEDKEVLQRGYAYVAPGAKHVTLEKGEDGYYFALDDSPPINRFKPSIDKAFFSVAKNVKSNAIGVILTGMGSDGAKGLKAMREQGAFTLAQDEETSVIYGMPKRALEIGAVEKVLPIHKIADAIMTQINKVK